MLAGRPIATSSSAWADQDGRQDRDRPVAQLIPATTATTRRAGRLGDCGTTPGSSAFAPYDDPRYAMSVLVEHGGLGAEAAAPKAAQLMRVAC